MPTKATREKVAFMLFSDTFTNGQLQKLTGIPASTISRFRKGQYKVRQRSFDRLKKSYRRAMFQLMRSYQISTAQSKELQNAPPQIIQRYINDYLSTARTLSATWRMPLADALKIMGKNPQLDPADFEKYI